MKAKAIYLLEKYNSKELAIQVAKEIQGTLKSYSIIDSNESLTNKVNFWDNVIKEITALPEYASNNTKTELKETLLRLLLNNIDETRLSKLKSLALDYTLDNNVMKNLEGTKYFKNTLIIYRDTSKAEEHLLKFCKDRDIQIENIEEVLEVNKTKNIYLKEEYEVINVDIFRSDKFAVKNLKTQQITYINNLPSEDSSDYTITIKKEEPVEIQIKKSINIEEALE